MQIETRMRMRKLLRAIFLVLSFCAGMPCYALDVSVTEIVDLRTNSKQPGKLEMQLKVLGEEATDVHGMRASVINAVDETGRDITEAAHAQQRLRYSTVVSSEKTIKISFKTPSRRATVVKELVGRLDLFIPKNDSEATVIVEDILSRAGKPLEAATLKNFDIEVVVLTKPQFVQIDRTTIGSLPLLDEKTVVIKLNDPDERIVNLELQSESGEKLRIRTVTNTGSLRVFQLFEPLSPKARVRIEVATLKSIVRVPFSFENILLP